MPANKPELPVEIKGKVIEKFLEVEEKRIDIDKLRENNIAKELEMSAKSSEQAFEISKLDLESKDKWFNNRFILRNRITLYIFIFVLIFLGIIAGIIFFFGKENTIIVEKLFTFLKDAIKIIGGGLIGYFAALARARLKKQIEE